jgi:hypothetical protein
VANAVVVGRHKPDDGDCEPEPIDLHSACPGEHDESTAGPHIGHG